MPDPAKPWVLLRKGHPPDYAANLDAAKFPHDFKRRNNTAEGDATVRGPGGVEWACGRFRSSRWIETTGQRRAEASRDEEVEA